MPHFSGLMLTKFICTLLSTVKLQKTLLPMSHSQQLWFNWSGMWSGLNIWKDTCDLIHLHSSCPRWLVRFLFSKLRLLLNYPPSQLASFLTEKIETNRREFLYTPVVSLQTYSYLGPFILRAQLVSWRHCSCPWGQPAFDALDSISSSPLKSITSAKYWLSIPPWN